MSDRAAQSCLISYLYSRTVSDSPLSFAAGEPVLYYLHSQTGELDRAIANAAAAEAVLSVVTLTVAPSLYARRHPRAYGIETHRRAHSVRDRRSEMASFVLRRTNFRNVRRPREKEREGSMSLRRKRASFNHLPCSRRARDHQNPSRADAHVPSSGGSCGLFSSTKKVKRVPK